MPGQKPKRFNRRERYKGFGRASKLSTDIYEATDRIVARVRPELTDAERARAAAIIAFDIQHPRKEPPYAAIRRTQQKVRRTLRGAAKAQVRQSRSTY